MAGFFDDPPQSKEEAQARSVRPPIERFKPNEQAYWTLTMVIAWIAWRDIDTVRRFWDNYRVECGDWVWIGDKAARDEAARIALQNMARAGAAPRDAELDQRLRSGDWQFWFSRPASRLDLDLYAARERPTVTIADATEQLWRAAGEGRLIASGLNCARFDEFSGWEEEIKAYSWGRLSMGTERTGKATLTGPDGRIYRDVKFARQNVTAIWAAQEQTVPTSTRATRAGAPPQYDWIAMKAHVLAELSNRGDPSDEGQTDNWNSQAAVERFVLDRFGREHPGKSTVAAYVKRWIEEWRAMEPSKN